MCMFENLPKKSALRSEMTNFELSVVRSGRRWTTNNIRFPVGRSCFGLFVVGFVFHSSKRLVGEEGQNEEGRQFMRITDVG